MLSACTLPSSLTEAVRSPTDTHNVQWYDPQSREYVMYTRDWGGCDVDGVIGCPGFPEGHLFRMVRRLQADRLVPAEPCAAENCSAPSPWGGSTIVIAADAVDNATHPSEQPCTDCYPPMDYYGPSVWPVDSGGRTVHWAFPWRLWHWYERGTNETVGCHHPTKGRVDLVACECGASPPLRPALCA